MFLRVTSRVAKRFFYELYLHITSSKNIDKTQKNKNKFTDRQLPDTNTPESDWKYKIIRIDKQINKINKQINKKKKIID